MRSPGSRSAIPVALACLALTAATLAAYSQVRHLDFLNFDDPLNVTENPMVRQGLTWRGFIWAFTAAHGSNWHPITWLSHMLDCQVFGLHPAGHHFVNLLLHIGNTLLLFGLLKKLSDAFWPSLLVAFWFGLHPLHVESVAWVAERKDVLSTSFALLCLWAYSRYARSGEERLPAQQDRGPHLLAAPVRWKTRGWYLLALALFAVGLMAKPMLVTLPFLLLFIDYWPLQRLRFPALRHSTTTPFRLVVEKLPFFILAILSCIVTIWAQHKGGSIIAVEAFPIQNRVANAVVSYWRYIGKLLWPSRLAAFYPFGAPDPLWVVALAGMGLVASTALALRAAKRPWLAVGWLWFVVTLVPVIGLVQVGQQAMADRYMYIPSIGLLIIFAFALAEVAAKVPRGGAVGVVLATASVGACFLITGKQIAYWRDSESLFRHAIAVTKGNYAAYNNLGTALEAEGRFDEAIGAFNEALNIRPRSAEARNNLGSTLSEQGRLAEAEVPLAGAIKFSPAYAEAHYNLGIVYRRQGRRQAAMQEFQRALTLKENLPNAHNNLGCLLMVDGRLDEAASHFRQALRYRPDDALALNNLGVTLTDLRRPADAVEPLTRASVLNPGYSDAHYNLGNALIALSKTNDAVKEYEAALCVDPLHNMAHYKLGNVFYTQGKNDQAAKEYGAALSANPTNAQAHYQLAVVLSARNDARTALPHYREAVRLKPDWIEALNNLAWLLATHTDPALRDGKQAVALALRQVELTRTNDAEALDTLAAAYAEAGLHEQAVETANRCVLLASATGQTNFATQAEQRLRLYQNRHPYRESQEPH